MQGGVNETVERRNFRKRRQNQEESFDDFLVKTYSYCTDACVNACTIKKL